MFHLTLCCVNPFMHVHQAALDSASSGEQVHSSFLLFSAYQEAPVAAGVLGYSRTQQGTSCMSSSITGRHPAVAHQTEEQ